VCKGAFSTIFIQPASHAKTYQSWWTATEANSGRIASYSENTKHNTIIEYFKYCFAHAELHNSRLGAQQL